RDDVVAELDALVADVDGGTRDELADVVLALAAEGALQGSIALTRPRHPSPNSLLLDLRRQRGLLAHGPGGRLRGDHFVDDLIFFGLLGGHEKVPIGVALDLLHALTGVVHEDAIELLAHAQNLAGLDVDVGGLTLHAAERLV